MTLNKIIFYVLTIVSGFYLIELTKISPIYIFFIISFIVFLICNINKIRIKIEFLDKIVLVFIIYVIFSQLKYNNLKLALIFVFQFIYFLFYRLTANYVKVRYIRKAVVYFLYFNSILLFLEMIYRIFYPLINKLEINSYYAFKMNSMMFADSNYVSMYILCILGLIEYFNISKRYKNFFYFLNFLTFSKSGILTMLLIPFIKQKNKYFKFLLIGIFFIGIYFIFLNSWTLKSKFYILKSMYVYMKNVPNKLEIFLFGVGLGNTSSKIGIGPHIIFINILFELGMIGLSIFLTIWYLIYKESNKKIKCIMLPVIISGLTLMPLYMPYFYIFSTLILKNENKFLRR